MTDPTPSASAAAPGCTRTHSIGTSTACILVTILAANLAATRTEASLPYLAQTAPLALRFSDPAPALPPAPERYVAVEPAPPAKKTAASPAAPEGSPSASANDNQTPDTPSATIATTPSSAAPSSSQTTPADEGAVILPDTYAPRPMVRIEDLLPYFVPPAPVPSRARYELK